MTNENKVAVVTGASRGIGKACALKLAKAGYTLVINYVSNPESAEAVVKEVEALGQKAISVKFDVSNAT